MTIEGVRGKETDKGAWAKDLAAADPGRIDRHNTSNVSLETAGGGVDTNRTFPADSRTRTQHHPEIESRLNSAALSMVSGMDTCRLCR